MTLINDATNSWSNAVTLTTNELWQCRAGSVFVSTTDNPASEDGLWLHEMHGLHLSAGLNVRYRKEGAGEAIIVRESV